MAKTPAGNHKKRVKAKPPTSYARNSTKGVITRTSSTLPAKRTSY